MNNEEDSEVGRGSETWDANIYRNNKRGMQEGMYGGNGHKVIVQQCKLAEYVLKQEVGDRPNRQTRRGDGHVDLEIQSVVNFRK